MIILQLRANLPLLIWTRRKFSFTLSTFWHFKVSHISEFEPPKTDRHFPSHKITCLPPPPSTEALQGTAAEFTEHEKSVSIALANRNNIQNKSTNINSTWTVSPLLREQAVCPLALLTFLNRKSLKDADTCNQSCCHLTTRSTEPSGYTPQPPPLQHLQPVWNLAFIKNIWSLGLHINKTKQLENSDKLTRAQKNTTKNKPLCFLSLLISQKKLGTSAGTASASIAQGVLAIYSQANSKAAPSARAGRKPGPAAAHLQAAFPRGTSTAAGSERAPGLRVLREAPAVLLRQRCLSHLRQSFPSVGLSGLRLLPVRLGKMKGKEIQRHG